MVIVVADDKSTTGVGVANLSLDGNKVIFLNADKNLDTDGGDYYEDEDNPYNFSFRTVNPTKADELRAFWEETEAKFGPIEIFVNNFAARTEPTEKGAKENLKNRKVFNAALTLAKEKMSKNGGVFVNMTSSWTILDDSRLLAQILAPQNILFVNIDLRTTPAEIFKNDTNGAVVVSEDHVAGFTDELFYNYINQFIGQNKKFNGDRTAVNRALAETEANHQQYAEIERRRIPFTIVQSRSRGISLPLEQPDRKLIATVSNFELFQKLKALDSPNYNLINCNVSDEDQLWNAIETSRQFISYLIINKENANEDYLLNFFRDATPKHGCTTIIILGTDDDDIRSFDNITIAHIPDYDSLLKYLKYT